MAVGFWEGFRFASLREAEEHLRAGDGIGYEILPADDDRGCGIGLPSDWGNQIGGALQSVSRVIKARGIGWPRQDHIGTIRDDGQWRRHW